MLFDLFNSPAELWMTALAVALVGLSRGGLGGMALLGVPLMALVMPPVTAAAILLPVLVIMDVVSFAAWRSHVHWGVMRAILPGSMAGIVIGWATAEMVTDAAIRLIVGLVAAAFVARAALGRGKGGGPPAPARERPWAGRFWGAVAGYTSFVAHAGSPPLQVYMMPLRLDPKVFTGTTVMFFAITNAAKLIPYAALGEFDARNLGRAAVMFPLAILATFAGAAIVRRMRAEIFYPFTYVSVALVAAKLIWDGVSGL